MLYWAKNTTREDPHNDKEDIIKYLVKKANELNEKEKQNIDDTIDNFSISI